MAADLTPPRDPVVWAVSWSGGKDSMLALDRAVRAGLDVRYLVTLYDPLSGRVRFHGTSLELLHRQAAALGRELLALAAPWDRFDQVFQDGLDTLAQRGVGGLTFGNIHLADVRAWYEERVVAHGLSHHEPLWGEPPAVLLDEVITRGYVARLVSVDTTRLPGSWLGRALDAACAGDLALRPDVDPCGEHGEYHTLVTDGPLFHRPLSVRPGRTHADGHFLLLDMELGTDRADDVSQTRGRPN
ncbi:MAG: adenosine nucleotide hydrolase [Chloroflexota bacterium]